MTRGAARSLAGRWGGRDGLAFGAAVLFAFCMYSSVVNLWPALGPLRPALLTCAVAAAALVARRVFRREKLGIDGWRGFCLLAVCVMCFMSQGWSVAPKVTHVYAQELAKDAACYLVLVYVVTNATRLRWILSAAALGGLAPAWYSFQNYLTGTDLVEGTRARWVGIYLDPNHMAMAMVFLVPVAIALILMGNVFERILGVASLLGSVTAVVVSGSRGGALGMGFAVLVWAVREKYRVRALTALGVLLALFLALSPKSFWNRTDTIADYHEDVSAQGRVHAWEVARAINEDRPLLGVGGGAFLEAWPHYAPVEARHEAFVAHNVFLAMLGELGWVGFFLFLFFASSALATGYRASRAPVAGPWIRAVFAGACGYMLCDMSAAYVTSAHFFFIFGVLAATGGIWAFEAGQSELLQARVCDEPSGAPLAREGAA